jgi:hypothetical protein
MFVGLIRKTILLWQKRNLAKKRDTALNSGYIMEKVKNKLLFHKYSVKFDPKNPPPPITK